MITRRAKVFWTPDDRMCALNNITFFAKRVILPFNEAREPWIKRQCEYASLIYPEANSVKTVCYFFRPEFSNILGSFLLERLYILGGRAEKTIRLDLAGIVGS